jgi:DNA-directed RNA polymerase beta' subunit
VGCEKVVNQEKAQPDKGWAKLVEEVKQKATKENVTQQLILKKVEGEEFRYTVSLMANPGRTPFVALSITRIVGRGAWGITLASVKEIDELIQLLQEVKKEFGELIAETSKQYKEAVKQLKKVMTYDANGSA